MNSLKRKISVVAAIIATAGVLGANAADNQPAPARTAASTATSTATVKTARVESPQLEYFESQESILSAPSYTPSEHPGAKPAPHSAHPRPSVWTDPMNTASLGS
jgi:hypothetical protein